MIRVERVSARLVSCNGLARRALRVGRAGGRGVSSGRDRSGRPGGRAGVREAALRRRPVASDLFVSECQLPVRSFANGFRRALASRTHRERSSFALLLSSALYTVQCY